MHAQVAQESPEGPTASSGPAAVPAASQQTDSRSPASPLVANSPGNSPANSRGSSVTPPSTPPPALPVFVDPCPDDVESSIDYPPPAQHPPSPLGRLRAFLVNYLPELGIGPTSGLPSHVPLGGFAVEWSVQGRRTSFGRTDAPAPTNVLDGPPAESPGDPVAFFDFRAGVMAPSAPDLREHIEPPAKPEVLELIDPISAEEITAAFPRGSTAPGPDGVSCRSQGRPGDLPRGHHELIPRGWGCAGIPSQGKDGVHSESGSAQLPW
ncbi:uncharacterized protein LOC135372064 [Ornithodoros turicata]|uniref:uncharacterized protein LOC135372064 n=1 Tax=Ornithodoros turicata TaxID=34597 RepID=UPI003139D5A2